ncbi:GDSL-type esterase/lipase family protein, partial [Akkermansia sp.]
GMRAVNLGFGYDRVENALWRLRHGELDGAADDAVCVVLLGTNNLAENTDGEILQGIRAVCGEITGRLKKAVIILQGFYPRNSARKDTAERIAAINLLLNRLAAEQGFLYTEPGRVMADAAGHVPEKLSSDGLHPSAAGYERIAAVLAPVIRQAAERKK